MENAQKDIPGRTMKRHGSTVMITQYIDVVKMDALFRKTASHLPIEMSYHTTHIFLKSSIVTSTSRSPHPSWPSNISTNMCTRVMIALQCPYNGNSGNEEKHSTK